jgi:predicted RNA binding protein YcfA (HicA-like mRNA interferase family)
LTAVSVAVLASAAAVRRPGTTIVKVRDVLKLLRRGGWILKNQEGSRRQFVHPNKSGKVTMAGHEADEIPPRTHKSIMKQAGIE